MTTLANDELTALLGLLEDADSAELKTTVPESDRRSALEALDIDPLDAQIRQVFFFDTPELALDDRGIVIRARRVQGKGDDSVVKLRPVDPARLSTSLRASPNFGVEVDAMPGGFVCSASLKASLPKPRVREAVRGLRPVSKVFTKEQRDFLADIAPWVSLDELDVLGPITVFKVKFTPEGLDRRLVAELWNYPDGSRILELSTKCGPQEAFQVAAETRAFLVGRGVDLTGEQQTKTRTALEYFASVHHPERSSP